MVLSLQQVKDRIDKPQRKEAIQAALNHENRIKLHTKAVDKKDKASEYFTEFLKWVQDGIGLPSDKFKAFEGMCRFPLPTTSLCNSIFDEYEKIFSAQDQYFDVELLDDTMKAEFKGYLEKNCVQKHFRSTGFKAYKKQPACIFVVDLPSVQISTRPEPYFYKVPILSVVDVNLVKTTEGSERIDLVIFKVGTERIVQIDDVYYRTFIKTEDSDAWMLVGESIHNLGYTPATFLPQNPLYDEEDNSPVARKTQVSDAIGDLDWLLFYKVAERMYETYGPFPILTVPETSCDYTDNLGSRCNGGFVPSTDRQGQPSSYPCPVCTKNNMVGPGTVFSKSVPKSKDQPQLDNPVNITPPDIDSLDYITKKIDYLEWEIYANCVGSNDQQVQKEAVNEKQVQSNVEGKRNVLQSIRKDFEACEKFIIDTMGRLMYGEYYITCTVNYGDQVLLYTAEDVTNQYINSKKAGLPLFYISQKKMQLIQTEFKNNPYEQRRADLLNMLEPWPDLSLNECLTYQLNSLYKEKFDLKLDFAKFVSKFENSNGDIVQWGSLLSLDQKIKRLTQILESYVKEQNKQQSEVPAGNSDQT
jgi:hypothetical protein